MRDPNVSNRMRFISVLACQLMSGLVSSAWAQEADRAAPTSRVQQVGGDQQADGAQLGDSDQLANDAESADDADSIDALSMEIDGPPPPITPQVVSRDDTGRVTLRAVRLPEGLVIDGRLDEEVYLTVPSITDFVQQEPDEGLLATEQTEVWIFFDDTNFYVSGRNWDSQPDQIVANEMRRDNRTISQNDSFTVLLDTFYDRRNGFMFQTNPLGALRDALITDERSVNNDWNTVWNVRTNRSDEGWTVEMAIPFKSLRYQPGREQVWGFQVRRGVQRKSEDSFITPIPRSLNVRGMYRFSQAATLVGIQAPAGSKNLEFKPYAISAVTGTRDNLDVLNNDLAGDIGFDAKYGLTQGLTADFTVNTDFAQVEDDQQQVNLTRFSLFFPEKREFFLEGQGIFSFGGTSAGRRGGGGGGGGGSTPILFFSRSIGLAGGEAIPIRAGARVTGRVGNYTVGLLNIQAGEDEATSSLSTNFTVVRVRRDILRRSTIGLIATNRSVSRDGIGSNQVYGVDASFSFFENLNISSYYAQTKTPGATGNETSYRASVSNNADRYGFSYSHLLVGDDFNPEIGFVRRDDFRQNRGSVRFTPRAPSIPAIRRFEYQLSLDHLASHTTGTLETRELQGRFQIEMENSDRVFINTSDTYEFLPQEFEISDGVVLPIGGYDFRDWNATYFFGPNRRASGRVTYGDGGFFNGNRRTLSMNSRVEVSPKLSVEPGLSLNWIELEQGDFTTTLVSTRVTYTMSPRMFVGALLQYNSSNDVVATNIRLRWEYEPGSDLFVVYSEGRETDFRGFPRLSNRGFVVKYTKLWRF